jgi:uncharacterized repeat protein (TIGR01451 family)
MPRARGVRLHLGESFLMRTTRFAALPIVALIALALPGVAAANTGSVTCDSTGVVFSYNANFGRDKVSTETVNGVTQQFTVPAHKAVTHTWPGLFGTLTVGATWSGGSIPTVTLMCPAPVTPPPPPPVAPPPPPVPPAPPAPPVTPPAPPVAPPVVPAVPETPAAPSPSPQIALKKRALAKVVQAGSVVKYQLVVTSKGGTAHSVVVCDKLPANMTYASLGNATLEGGRACWNIGDLTGSVTLSLSARVDTDATGSLTNNSTATSSNAGRAKAHATIEVPAKHGVKGKFKRTAGVTG